MDPKVGKPYDVTNPDTWGKTNFYSLNQNTVQHPVQTRIGGHLRKKTKKNIKKIKKNKKYFSKKNKKYLKKKSKKGGGILDERFTFPGVNTTRNIINSGENIYNTLSGKQLNVSPNPMIQPINKNYSGST
jgi:hypothetical protein